jgi:hypothetical protein
MLLLHGTEGCAGEVAEEFGEHPESAVRRMCWVHDELRLIAVERAAVGN